GNLGQPNRLYLNDDQGNFFPGSNIGTAQLDISVDPTTTRDNVTVQDLLADLQQALDAALTAKGIAPGSIKVAIDGLVFIGFQGAGVENLPESIAAARAVTDARRDGILVTSNGQPLTFDLTYDKKTVNVSLDPNGTLDNRTALGLVQDLQ